MGHGTSLGIKSRPLDFYVAFLVFFMGFYSVLDPTWPERYSNDPLTYWILLVEDIYLMVAGAVIMLSLIAMQTMYFRHRPRIIVSALVSEMFGWLFIACASAVVAISTPWIPPSAFAGTEGPLLWIWAALWVGMALSAGMRYWDIRSLTRGKK